MNASTNFEPDLGSLLPEGVRLEPFFKQDEDYHAFRQRYAEKVRPELEKQAGQRRRSEEEARRRLLG